MQWTQELNSLLNQCVFASGYDFDAASELFCQQANKLQLWTGEELVLSANQYQEQWMALNPTEEDEDEDKAEDPKTPTDDLVDDVGEESGYVFVTDGGPRLELSLSDAELDLLLSTLPPSEEPEDVSSSTSADAKDGQNQPRSEMQWVLAFLTDPDAIASVDADAKNLMGSCEKLDDDNYQVFLQDVQDANLVAPFSSGEGKLDRRLQQQRAETASSNVGNDEDSSSDESEEDWERTRQEMKHSLKLR